MIIPVPSIEFIDDHINPFSIKLSWAKDTDANGFKIERSLDGLSFTEVADNSKLQLDYLDTDIDNEVIYYYRIKAYNDTTETAYSNIIFYFTPTEKSDILYAIAESFIHSETLKVKIIDDNSGAFYTQAEVLPIYTALAQEEGRFDITLLAISENLKDLFLGNIVTYEEGAIGDATITIYSEVAGGASTMTIYEEADASGEHTITIYEESGSSGTHTITTYEEGI